MSKLFTRVSAASRIWNCANSPCGVSCINPNAVPSRSLSSIFSSTACATNSSSFRCLMLKQAPTIAAKDMTIQLILDVPIGNGTSRFRKNKMASRMRPQKNCQCDVQSAVAVHSERNRFRQFMMRLAVQRLPRSLRFSSMRVSPLCIGRSVRELLNILCVREVRSRSLSPWWPSVYHKRTR